VTGVQTCALPIWNEPRALKFVSAGPRRHSWPTQGAGNTMRSYARIPTSTAGKSGRSLRPVSTCLVFGDDHAEVDDSPLRVGVIADAAPLRENLVELDSDGRSR